MPKEIKLYTVFLASPSDVKTERTIVSNIITELNGTIGTINNIILELFSYEASVFPNMGNDPQEVINVQMPDEIDFFIGIFWTRLGTPTSRFDSGTEEEFQHAYSQWQADNKSIKMMMYFKNDTLPYNVDLDQLKRLREFKSFVETKALITQFNDSEEFEKLLRLQLTLAINETISPRNTVTKGTVIVNLDSKLETSSVTEDDNGYFENMDALQNNFEECAIVLNRIVDYLHVLTENMNIKTESLSLINTYSAEIRAIETRKAIDLVADDLLEFANNSEIEIEIYKDKFEKGFNHYTKIHEFSIQYSNDETIKENKDSIEAFKQTIYGVIPNLTHFKDVIEKGVPPLTSKFIKAQKAATEVLDKIIKQFSFSIQLIENLQGSEEF